MEFAAGQAPKMASLVYMVEGIQSDDPARQIDCTTPFRKLLAKKANTPIQDVIDAGAVPRFVEFLGKHDNPELQFQAAWALTNIASGDSDYVKVIIELGVLPATIGLLQSASNDVREQAVWCLGNIAGDSVKHRDAVHKAGALQPLLDQYKENPKNSMLRNVTWTLSNLCRSKPRPPAAVASAALPFLCMLIVQTDDVEALADGCWALSYLSDGSNADIAAVIAAGVCVRLVELLEHQRYTVQVPVVRTVGNIVTGDDAQTQVIIDCGALPKLLKLLSSPKKGIRKETSWMLSNITSGNGEQIQAVLDADLIPPLVYMLQHDCLDVKKEAAYVISNAASGGTSKQIEYLVSHGSIPPMCDLLKVADTSILTVALTGLQVVLRAGNSKKNALGLPKNPYAVKVEDADGLALLDGLKGHDNEEVSTLACSIAEVFFGAGGANG